MSVTYQFCVAQSSAGAETWRSAEELGVTVDVRSRVHAGIDTLVLSFGGQTVLTDDAIWAFGTVVRMRSWNGSAGTYLFLGRVQPFARAATGIAHASTVEIRGIWDWFANIVFRQQWQEEVNYVTSPRVVLFGSRSTGQQITQAINCAIASGCPVATGTIAAGYTPPRDEQMNVSVSDVIIKCLSNHPHACLWVDYSTRTPTVNVVTRQSLPSFTVSLTAEQAEALTIKSREDLQPGAVAIAYVRTNTDGDRSWISTNIDKAPANATDAQLYAVGAIWGVFDLQGSNAQYIEQKVETESVDWDNNKDDPDWWKARVPGIADANIISISNPSGQFDYPNFLTEGSCAEWMNVEWANETFTADAKIQRSNSEGVVERRVEKISFTAVTTNATSKTYRQQTSFDSGEIPPGGLAAQMLAEWQQIHHDGEITLAAQDVPLGAGPGMTLNLTGGRAEWVNMLAMIIGVTEDFGNGRLTIRFGVPQWIDLDSRMAWVRNCRLRRWGWAVDQQQSGSGSDASGGQAFPSSTPGSQPTVWLRQRFIDPSATVKHEVDINLDDISDSVKRTLKLREIKVLVEDGDNLVAQSVLAICSEPYGDTQPAGGGFFDIRYNSSNHCLEKKTEDGGNWSTITGGQAVQETV